MPTGKELLLFIENPFLGVDTTEFSVKANDIFKWVDAAKVQLELIEIQQNVVVKNYSVIVNQRIFGPRKGS